jgi:isoleucyl-tRNA synthetase
VSVKDSLPLDQWAVQQALDTQYAVIEAYQKYDFPEIVQRVQNFCTNEMGAAYLDMTKDRLYMMRADSFGRRSAQSAMYRILEAVVRWLAPILSFTAEEIWQFLPPRTDRGPRSESVLFETWYDGLEATQGSQQRRDFWKHWFAIRSAIAKRLEELRKAEDPEKRVGSSLDAEVDIYFTASPGGGMPNRYSELKVDPKDELRFLLIVSDARTHDSCDAEVLADPDGRWVEGAKELGVFFVARRSARRKCIRCWHHRPDVGADLDHPDICLRCGSNVDVDGPGENRRFA